MVLADSYKISRVPYYLGYSQMSKLFVYRTVTVFGSPFQSSSTKFLQFFIESRNPSKTYVLLVWAVPRSLAAT